MSKKTLLLVEYKLDSSKSEDDFLTASYSYEAEYLKNKKWFIGRTLCKKDWENWMDIIYRWDRENLPKDEMLSNDSCRKMFSFVNAKSIRCSILDVVEKEEK